MISRDYFMRMTEMLAAVIAKVLFNKEQKNFEAARKELETAAKSIVGLDLKLLGVMSIENVSELMKASDLYGGRCIIAAELLNEYADTFTEENPNPMTADYCKKSLLLYLEGVLSNELPEPEKYFSKINNLVDKLSASEFPESINKKLFRYYEYSGNYSKAEDVLFELIDINSEEIFANALSFYERLRLKSDAELHSGNFSKEEVEDGIAEIQSLIEDSGQDLQ